MSREELISKFMRFSHDERRMIINLLDSIDQSLRADIPDELWIYLYRSARHHVPTLGGLRCTCKRFASILPPAEDVIEKDENISPWVRKLCFELNRRPGFVGTVFYYSTDDSSNATSTTLSIYQKPAIWDSRNNFETLIIVSKLSGRITTRELHGTTWSAHIADKNLLDLFKLVNYEHIMYYCVELSRLESVEMRKVEFETRNAIHKKWQDICCHKQRTVEDIKFMESQKHKLIIK
jgi:hypothetical protein